MSIRIVWLIFCLFLVLPISKSIETESFEPSSNQKEVQAQVQAQGHPEVQVHPEAIYKLFNSTQPPLTFEQLSRLSLESKEILKVDWSDLKEKDLFIHLQTGNLYTSFPIIIKLHPRIQKLKFLKRWNKSYLTQKINKFHKVETSLSRVIMFRNISKPMANLEGLRFDEGQARFNVHSSEFFEKILWENDSEGDLFYYHHDRLNNFHELQGDLENFDWMCNELNKKINYFGAEAKQSNLWIGGRNVTAHLHYDSFANAYVQLFGTKEFRLLPPSFIPSIYLYSSLHPHAHQSQVDLDAVDNLIFPQFPMDHFLTADLVAGDILLLPPYWLHHVIATNFSFSANIWCPSLQFQNEISLIQLKPPFDPSWPYEGALVALRTFLFMIMDQVVMRNDFISDLINIRYSPLYRGADRAQRLASENSICWIGSSGNSECDLISEDLESLPLLNIHFQICQINKINFLDRSEVKSALSLFGPFIQHFAIQANNIPYIQIKEMIIMDYVETVTLNILGDINRVLPFFNQCF